MDDEEALACVADEDCLDPELDAAVTSFIQAEALGSQSDTSDTNDEENEYPDFKSIEGWEKIAALVALLVDIKVAPLSTQDANQIVQLYDDLSPYDKKPMVARLNRLAVDLAGQKTKVGMLVSMP